MIVYRKQNFIISDTFMACTQRAKKVVSDSPGLMDFVIGLVNSVFDLPDEQVMFLSNSNKGRTVKSILFVKKLLGLVQMMSGLVNASSLRNRACRYASLVNANFSVNQMCPIICRWKLVKHRYCFGDNRRTKDNRKIKLCGLKACCVT